MHNAAATLYILSLILEPNFLLPFESSSVGQSTADTSSSDVGATSTFVYLTNEFDFIPVPLNTCASSGTQGRKSNSIAMFLHRRQQTPMDSFSTLMYHYLQSLKTKTKQAFGSVPREFLIG